VNTQMHLVSLTENTSSSVTQQVVAQRKNTIWKLKTDGQPKYPSNAAPAQLPAKKPTTSLLTSSSEHGSSSGERDAVH
jgi:hypothetical protein